MDESEKPLGSSFQRLADSLLNTLRNRLELLGVELQEEFHWALSTFCWAAGCLFLTFATLLVITFTTMVLVPEEARTAVMIGFSVAYLAATIGSLLILRNKLKKRPPPFHDSVAELRKDVDCLRAPE